MRTHFVPLIVCTLFHSGTSHYVFSHLLVNNTDTGHFKYVRDVGMAKGYTGEYCCGAEEFGKTPPIHPFLEGYEDEVAIRCGRKSELAAPKTETATIIAGTEVGFRIATHIASAYTQIAHPGPAQVYLHRTEDLQNDIGDGDWFKIAYQGPFNDTIWTTQMDARTDVNFTIPVTTPPGTYLLRMEHFMPLPSPTIGYDQWYVNCAHVNIIGPGGGNPGPMVRIPDVYHADDPGINLPKGMGQIHGLDKYVPPGPAVWTG